MRYLILAALMGGGLAGTAGGESKDSADRLIRAVEQAVLAAEDQYVAAEVNRDEAALRRLVDDRFVFNASDGRTTGKDELIRDVLGMAMTGQTLRERSVLVEGGIALVFGTAELHFARPGEEDSVSVLRYTATYVNRQGQWRMLALQMQQRAPG